MSRVFAVLYVLVILFSCSEKTNFDVLNEFFMEEYEFDRMDEYENIVIINTMGTCLNCNNSFSKEMAANIAQKETLFLISTSGSRIDISGFLDARGDNVLFDFENKFAQLELINSCAIIELGEDRVDRIVEINLENITEELAAFTR